MQLDSERRAAIYRACRALRAQHWTFQKIGDLFGHTRQWAHQVVEGYGVLYDRRVAGRAGGAYRCRLCKRRGHTARRCARLALDGTEHRP